VEQLLVRRKESFDDRVAKRASAAAAPLASWVRANVSYSRVLERITPLEQEQANLRKQVGVFMKKLFQNLSNHFCLFSFTPGIFRRPKTT
jgi:dynein heavy chain 2